MSVQRQHARQVFQAGIEAADPYQAVQRCLNLQDVAAEKIHLIAFGKAACAMATAAVDIIPSARLASAIAVTNYENVTAVNKVEVIGAGHPLPDANGFQAAQKIAHLVQHASADTTILVLISGGGSALLPYPVDGITLEEKIATTNALLASGATINEINCVRKHLSALKGGGLARLAFPTKIHALILSDVLGDDLSTIASGPTVADITTYSDAIAILKQNNVWLSAPASVRHHLEQGEQGLLADTPKPNDTVFKNTHSQLCGSNALSLQAAQHTAEQLGYHTQIYSTQLCGIAKDEAQQLARYAVKIAPTSAKPLALLAGGETTVNLQGNGKGGRNQEFALAFALAAEQHGLTGEWTLLSGGTDGRDGPTDAAGGMVDKHSLHHIRQAGLNPAQYLNNNDAYHALQSTNDLLITGATGTNVADLQILLLHSKETPNV